MDLWPACKETLTMIKIRKDVHLLRYSSVNVKNHPYPHIISSFYFLYKNIIKLVKEILTDRSNQLKMNRLRQRD